MCQNEINEDSTMTFSIRWNRHYSRCFKKWRHLRHTFFAIYDKKFLCPSIWIIILCYERAGLKFLCSLSCICLRPCVLGNKRTRAFFFLYFWPEKQGHFQNCWFKIPCPELSFQFESAVFIFPFKENGFTVISEWES